VKIFVQFGVRNKQVSGFIANDRPGMDCNTLIMAFNRVYDVVELVTGHVLSAEIVLTTFETNRDFLGRRLDGQITCLTKQELFEVLEKVYQKEEDVVRSELKVTRNWKVESAVRVLKGQYPTVSASQGLYEVKKGLEAVGWRLQFFSGELVEINRRSDFFAGDVRDKVDGLGKRLDVLEGDLVRMVDILEKVLNGGNGVDKSHASPSVERSNPDSTYIS
jgi:hypothetical protein